MWSACGEEMSGVLNLSKKQPPKDPQTKHPPFSRNIAVAFEVTADCNSAGLCCLVNKCLKNSEEKNLSFIAVY